MKHLAALALVLVAACSGSSTSSPGPASGSSQPPPPPPPPSGSGAEPAALDLAKLGQPCTDGACAAPMECVKYYGIAGPRGPEFSSCEIRCSEKSACPTGTHCATVADGPGAVCRPH